MIRKTRDLFKLRIISIIALIVLSIMGFWMWRYYHGREQYLVRYYISGIVYVMILSVGFFIIWPSSKNVLRIPVIAFIFTCCLEVLQLYKPPFLQAIRATLIGQAILGTDFVWLQFPFYIAGGLCSYLLLKFLFLFKKPDYQY